ncbi:hypothetical protein N0V95_010042 [Ascochyta clinopodiicola]|nr:hypothetical protein N0V95_010042 [Ascochyta clinopodiicola]
MASIASTGSPDISGSKGLSAAPSVPTSTFPSGFSATWASLETASPSPASDQDASFRSALASVVSQSTVDQGYLHGKSCYLRATLPGVHSLTSTEQQEQTQLKTLRGLLHRSGGQDVPACRYLLPSNTTELVMLMGALKSVELGVFMSLSDSLPPSDTSASVLLSSIASVAAKQYALLRTYTSRNASIEPFDTPSSGTWAYNVALGFVQPGSCALELPLPILPMLTMNNRIAGYAWPGANATFGWDVAGRSAASRSGKPLFVAWVNQVDAPVFTPLTLHGDGFGTTRVPLGLSGTAFAVLTAQPGLTTIDELTDATLAGPVVVNL